MITIEQIKKIITKIEDNKKLKDKEIEDVLNNIDYIALNGFTNKIGHLTLKGKNEIVQAYKFEIVEELHKYIYLKEIQGVLF